MGGEHDWKLQALCRMSATPEIFFPEETGAPGLAKAICRRCPVRAPCLKAAIRWSEPIGVWGGLTARERRKLVKRRGLRLRTGQ